MSLAEVYWLRHTKYKPDGGGILLWGYITVSMDDVLTVGENLFQSDRYLHFIVKISLPKLERFFFLYIELYTGWRCTGTFSSLLSVPVSYYCLVYMFSFLFLYAHVCTCALVHLMFKEKKKN